MHTFHVPAGRLSTAGSQHKEFIVGNYISSDRNDVHTLIPFMGYLNRYKIKNIVADSGYESEGNYCYFESQNRPTLYVKPSNHEQKKKRKYQRDISRRGNMPYDADTDCYTCAAGKQQLHHKFKNDRLGTGIVIPKGYPAGL